MTERIYILNPYIRDFEANVKEKRYKDDKYYIKLDKTIFYPHLSGGQPGDTGTIGGIRVESVYEEGDDIVHMLSSNVSGNRVRLSIDWEHRLDMMQQHTGQHLLSYTFYRLYGGKTVGFNIGNDYSYVDIDIPYLSNDEAEKVESLANRIIQSNFKIKSYFISNEDLKKIPLRKMPTVEKNIRIVEIDELDYNPCGGTHLRNTGEIGLIKIVKWERNRGNVRVQFVSGERSLKDYNWKNKYIKEISNLLSCKDKDLMDKVNKLYADKEELEKANRTLRENLYEFKGSVFWGDGTDYKGVKIIFKTIHQMDFKELGLIAGNLSNNKEKLVQIYGLQNEDKYQFYVSRSKDMNLELQEIYKKVSEEYKIKGGGNSHTVQGGATKENLELILNQFLNLIKRSL